MCLYDGLPMYYEYASVYMMMMVIAVMMLFIIHIVYNRDSEDLLAQLEKREKEDSRYSQ